MRARSASLTTEPMTGRGSKRWALAADIGGTKARFATCDLDGSHVAPLPPLVTRDHASIGDAIRAALGDKAGRPDIVSFAIAAPITGQTVTLTNAQWSFTTDDVKRATGASRVQLINDFEALARVLPRLTPDDLSTVVEGAPDLSAPCVVVGPGTGLGAASAIKSSSGWHALASEGGHITFGATCKDEWLVYDYLAQHHAHVSMERVLSGGGIEATFAAFGGERLAAPQVVERADAADPLARRTIEFFAATLARFAGDMALMVGGRGGVYLGGGIAPRLVQYLNTDAFRDAFRSKGRMSDYLSAVPVHVITAPDAGLRGAAVALSDLMTDADRAGWAHR